MALESAISAPCDGRVHRRTPGRPARQPRLGVGSRRPQRHFCTTPECVRYYVRGAGAALSRSCRATCAPSEFSAPGPSWAAPPARERSVVGSARVCSSPRGLSRGAARQTWVLRRRRDCRAGRAEYPACQRRFPSLSFIASLHRAHPPPPSVVPPAPRPSRAAPCARTLPRRAPPAPRPVLGPFRPAASASGWPSALGSTLHRLPSPYP